MPYEIFMQCGHNEIVMTASWFLRRHGSENWGMINKTRFCKECNDYCRIIKVVKRLWYDRGGISEPYRQN